MPPKYILGYYYIHNPLLVTLGAKKVDCPHLTPPQKWVMNQECQREGEKRKIGHIPEVSRTDSAGNNPWALNSMLVQNVNRV